MYPDLSVIRPDFFQEALTPLVIEMQEKRRDFLR